MMKAQKDSRSIYQLSESAACSKVVSELKKQNSSYMHIDLNDQTNETC